MTTTHSAELVVKELADALGVSTRYVYLMRRHGFRMHGEHWHNQTCRVAEALVWIKREGFRLRHGIPQVGKAGSKCDC